MCFGHVKFPQIATVRTKLKLSSLAGSARGWGRWPGVATHVSREYLSNRILVQQSDLRILCLGLLLKLCIYFSVGNTFTLSSYEKA